MPLPPPVRFDGTVAPELASVTVDDVVTARRELAGQRPESALDRLAEWVNLAPERARQLAQAAASSAKALAGASQSLPPEEAAPLLEAAVKDYPEEPCLRLLLAKAYDAQPGQQAKAAAELDKLSSLDPQNALPNYVRARDALREGDIEQALALLDEAASQDAVNAYAGENALYREQALEESGMNADAARMTAALTAGTPEYDYLTQLGQDMLNQGAELDDLEAAQAVFEAVYTLGKQLQTAKFSGERLAGLDVERSTIDALEQVYTSLQNTEGLAWLAGEVNDLTRGIEEMYAFFDSVDAYFNQQLTGWQTVADQILATGDLSLVEQLFTIPPAEPAPSPAE